MFNPISWDAHAFPVFFGGTKLSEYGTIVSVPAIQMVYFVTANTKRQDAMYVYSIYIYYLYVRKGMINKMYRFFFKSAAN